MDPIVPKRNSLGADHFFSVSIPAYISDLVNNPRLPSPSIISSAKTAEDYLQEAEGPIDPTALINLGTDHAGTDHAENNDGAVTPAEARTTNVAESLLSELQTKYPHRTWEISEAKKLVQKINDLTARVKDAEHDDEGTRLTRDLNYLMRQAESRLKNISRPRLRIHEKLSALASGPLFALGVIALLALTASNPIGWVLLGLGLGIGAALLLTSRPEKHDVLLKYIGWGMYQGEAFDAMFYAQQMAVFAAALPVESRPMNIEMNSLDVYGKHDTGSQNRAE